MLLLIYIYFITYCEILKCCDIDVMVLYSNYIRFYNNIFVLNIKVLIVVIILCINFFNLELKIDVVSCFYLFTFYLIISKNLVLKDRFNFGFILCII